jgi:hypothetical protein
MIYIITPIRTKECIAERWPLGNKQGRRNWFLLKHKICWYQKTILCESWNWVFCLAGEHWQWAAKWHVSGTQRNTSQDQVGFEWRSAGSAVIYLFLLSARKAITVYLRRLLDPTLFNQGMSEISEICERISVNISVLKLLWWLLGLFKTNSCFCHEFY